MKKKLIKILTFLMICCFSIGIVACKDEAENQKPIKPTITISASSVNLILGDSVQLTADYSKEKWVDFTWQSLNQEVAVVDNSGKVSAVGVGETKVLAKYAGITAQCEVKVNIGDNAPTLYKKHGFSNQITAYVGSQYQLDYGISFNKQTYSDGQFFFESSNEQAVSVDASGKITIKEKTAEAVKITVSGKWLGKEYPSLYEVIEIKVIEDVQIIVDGGLTGQIKIYTVNNHNGQTFPVSQDIDIEVLHNGQKVSENDYSVVIADNGESVATFDNGTVSSVAYGNTKLLISYGEFVKEIPIEVARPVTEYKGGAVDFSAYKGTLDWEKIFDKQDVQIIDAYQGEKELTVKDNAIFGLSLERDKLTNTSVTVLDDKEGYIVSLEAAYARVKTEQDLSFLNVKSGTTISDNINGYIVLESDITLSEAFKHPGVDTTGYYLSTTVGFAGVFDGNGFKITAPIDRAGLFGAVVANTESEQTVIKNVRFDLDVQLSSGGRDSKDHAAGLFYLVGNMSAKNRITLQDVFVKISGRVGDFSGICAYDTYCLDYKNVFVDLSDLVATKGYVFGRIDGYVARGLASQREGIKVISDLPFATTQTGLENVPSNLIYYASNKYATAEGTEYDVKVPIDNSLQYKIEAKGAKQYANYKQLYDASQNLLNVEYKDGYELVIENQNLNMTEQTTASLSKNGSKIDFTLSASNDCISCVGDVIKANHDGAAIITATYKIDGLTYSKYKLVCVGQGQLTVVDYNTQDNPYTFSVVDGELPNGMLSSGETAVRAVADKQTLTVEDGKVKGFTLSVDDYGRDVASSLLISVYTDQATLYKVYVKAYTKTIDSEEDMLYFNLSEEKSFTGTYIMTANVNVSQTTASKITHDVVTKICDVLYGFKGIFDGDGYTLSGYIPTKGYFGAMRYYGEIKNLAINATPYLTSGVSNVVFALAGGAGGNASMPLIMNNVSVKVSGTVSTFAGIFGRSFGFLRSNSLLVDLSELTASSGYVISSEVSTGYIKQANIYAVSSLEIAKVTHWRGGKFITSNQKIADGATMNSDGGYYYTLGGVNYWTFDGSIDNSSINAKGVLYANYEELLKNQTTIDSYTGYGDTEQFSDTTYWEITLKTVGGVAGYMPVWKNK